MEDDIHTVGSIKRLFEIALMPSQICLPSILLDKGHNKGTFDLYLEHNQIGPPAQGEYLS